MNPKPILDPATLYIGDNGRMFCGTQRCAGVTAFYTGRDLSGGPLLVVDDTVADALRAEGCSVECETCRHRHGDDPQEAQAEWDDDTRAQQERDELYTFTLY